MAYSATVARVFTRPHPNADRLQLGDCMGYQVIVGKDVEDGTLGIFFPPDGQLSEEYVRANDLYARDPKTGEKGGGFFDKNRRVRALRLRGERSEGYFASFESLDNMVGGRINQPAHMLLKEGDEITEFDGLPLCNRYETPATKKALANRQKQAKRLNAHFAKHFDTEQLKRGIRDIPEGAILFFTEKLHGTSQRSGHVMDSEYEPTRRERFAQWLVNKILGGSAKPTKYDIFLGTRNVILGRWKGESYYGKEGFRYRLHDRIKDKLRKGETVYYEVVGWTDDGGSIMPQVGTKDLKDIAKQYGEKVVYSYGNPQGESEMYVYRITQQNAEGIPMDLSWEQVKGRSEELGVPHVPEILEDGATALTYHPSVATPQMLLDLAEQHSHGPSLLDDSHIREGVAVRWEKGSKIGILKQKSFEFLVLEGVAKSDENVVDLEEAS